VFLYVWFGYVDELVELGLGGVGVLAQRGDELVVDGVYLFIIGCFCDLLRNQT